MNKNYNPLVRWQEVQLVMDKKTKERGRISYVSDNNTVIVTFPNNKEVTYHRAQKELLPLEFLQSMPHSSYYQLHKRYRDLIDFR